MRRKRRRWSAAHLLLSAVCLHQGGAARLLLPAVKGHSDNELAI